MVDPRQASGKKAKGGLESRPDSFPPAMVQDSPIPISIREPQGWTDRRVDNEIEGVHTGQSLRLKGESWGMEQSVLKGQGEDIRSKS